MCHQTPNRKSYSTDHLILMPLDKFVVKVTGEAEAGDEQGIKKAVRRYHNRLANGSIPRSVFRKIGKQLFVHLRNFSTYANI